LPERLPYYIIDLMTRKRKIGQKQDLKKAAKQSTSIRQVLQKIGLIEAGGNYAQVKKYLKTYKIDTSHF